MTIQRGGAAASVGAFQSSRFVDEAVITSEPRGDFGRYFLAVEGWLAERGLSVRRIAPVDLVAINEANRESWPPLISNLDYREYPMDPDEVSMIACFDQAGRAVGTSGVRRFDVTGSTVAADLESLALWYGPRAAAMRARRSCEVTAPGAHRLTGRVLYHGGFWIHPDVRRSGLAAVLPRLNRCLALAERPYDYEILMASKALLEPRVAANYELEATELSYALAENGSVLFSGVFCWASSGWITRVMQRDLASLQAQSSDHLRGDPEQALVAAARR